MGRQRYAAVYVTQRPSYAVMLARGPTEKVTHITKQVGHAPPSTFETLQRAQSHSTLRRKSGAFPNFFVIHMNAQLFACSSLCHFENICDGSRKSPAGQAVPSEPAYRYSSSTRCSHHALASAAGLPSHDPALPWGKADASSSIMARLSLLTASKVVPALSWC